MDLFNDIPGWVGQAGAGALVLIAVYIMGQVNNRTLLFLQELNRDRDEVATERKAMQEKATSVFETLTNELKTAMASQREVYEGKLALIEAQHSSEREKWAEQVKHLTAQIKALTDRITKLEQEGKSKDEEIARLKAQLAEVIVERDAALARLAALPVPSDIKPAEDKPGDQSIAA